MLNTRILSLSVLSNQDGVDIVVRCLEALYGDTRSDVGEEVESSSQSQVERDVALSDYEWDSETDEPDGAKTYWGWPVVLQKREWVSKAIYREAYP